MCSVTRKNLILLHANNKAADQPVSTPLLFFLENTVAPLATRFNMPANFCSRVDFFESYFVGNPEDRFSHDEAQ